MEELRVSYVDPSQARALVRKTGLFGGWDPIDRPARQWIQVESLRVLGQRRAELNSGVDGMNQGAREGNPPAREALIPVQFAQSGVSVPEQRTATLENAETEVGPLTPETARASHPFVETARTGAAPPATAPLPPAMAPLPPATSAAPASHTSPSQSELLVHQNVSLLPFPMTSPARCQRSVPPSHTSTRRAIEFNASFRHLSALSQTTSSFPI